MTIAIHQPNYFPWLGYFFKMYLSDVFVFHDVVSLSKQSYARRTKVLKDKGSPVTRWLSVPLRSYTTKTPLHLIEIDNTQEWRQAHLNRISNAYNGAPFFETVYRMLEEALDETKQFSCVAEANRYLIHTVAREVGITCTTRNSSEMHVDGTGSKLNLQILKQQNADTYISGTGARDYQAETEFHNAGIHLVYHELGDWLNSNGYDQGLNQFVHGLSTIDALMHIGVAGINALFDKYAKITMRRA